MNEPKFDDDERGEFAKAFERLKRENAIVAAALKLSPVISEVESLKMAIVLLATAAQNAINESIEASKITPIRIKTSDGKIRRWDAPDRFVPLKDFADLDLRDRARYVLATEGEE